MGVALLGGPDEALAEPGAPDRDRRGAEVAIPRLMAWLPGPVPPPEPVIVEPEPVAVEEPVEPPEVEPVIYGPPLVYLTAIVYFDAGAWSIWLNGARVTPDQPLAHVDVVSVSREAVDLALHVASDRPPVAVRLRPNQTFVASTGRVTEGVPSTPVAAYTSAPQ